MHQPVQDTKDFRLQLVASIQKFPSLWDKKHPVYGQRSGYWEKWQQIAVSLGNGVPASTARSRWRYLCKNYQKYLQARATGNSKIAFDLAQPMEFMAPHIEVEGSGSRDQDTDDEEDGFSSEAGDAEQERVLRTGTNCKHLAVDGNNADALFLLSMLPEMSRMCAEQKRNFKIEVMELSRRYNDYN